MVSTAAYRAEKEAEGDPADAVIWDELAARTREESSLNVTYLTFLSLACLIAAVGVVTDSSRSRSCAAAATWHVGLCGRC